MSSQNLTTLKHRIHSLLERAHGKKILVVGGGVTGRAVAALLARANFHVTVIDERSVAKATRDELAGLDIAYREEFQVNEESVQELEQGEFALAVLSPGIGFESPLGRAVGRAGIPKISEIDLGIAFVGMPEVAVTGTNGKTTTVTLIHEMLLASQLQSELVGNVGRPFVSLITPAKLERSAALGEEYQSTAKLVAEVSSYQLESAFDFAPHIGVFLNIEDDHLERHGSFSDYLLAKSRIFSGQDKERDWAIVWADDPSIKKIRSHVRSKYLPVGIVTAERLMEPNSCLIDETAQEIVLKLNSAELGTTESYSLSEWRPLGLHNRINLAAAIAAARLAGATPAGINKVIETFRSLPHRIEVVAEKKGVLYVNDSKGTNVSAAKVALETVLATSRNQKVVLLLGGKAKEGSWAPLKESLTANVRQIITFGASRDLIPEVLGAEEGVVSNGLFVKIPISVSASLADALAVAAEIADHGDIVLLSPACASFDAYSDYTQRGDHFRSLVEQYPN